MIPLWLIMVFILVTTAIPLMLLNSLRIVVLVFLINLNGLNWLYSLLLHLIYNSIRLLLTKLQTACSSSIVNMNTLNVIDVDTTYSPSTHERDYAFHGLLKGIEKWSTWYNVDLRLCGRHGDTLCVLNVIEQLLGRGICQGVLR